MDNFGTVCNLCSIGCSMEVSCENANNYSVKGRQGLVNAEGAYCEYPITVYNNFSKEARITSPLIKEGNGFKKISWNEAFNILHDRVTTGNPKEKAFFAGARLTNEEQYLVQKLARAGALSNDIGSFHYLGRGTGYTKLSKANIPFFELSDAKRIFVIGADLTSDYPVVGDIILRNKKEAGIDIEVITENSADGLVAHAGKHLVVSSYFYFIKAVNYYLLKNDLQDNVYINNLIDNFNEFKTGLLSIDYDELVKKSGLTKEAIEEFALRYLNEPNAVIIFSENSLSSNTCGEIFNLALITGKHGRTGAGLCLLKEKNNSHGLHDMGAMSNLSTGATSWDDPFQRNSVQIGWGSKDLPSYIPDIKEKLESGDYKSLFIFGEDPVGCAINGEPIVDYLSKADFIMVQDYFLTPTAQMADLVLPASLAFETGGTFTNCQRVIQQVDKSLNSPLEYNSWQQINEILVRNGFPQFDNVIDITFEMAGLLPKFCTSSKLMFRVHDHDNYNQLFEYGCDALQRLAKKVSAAKVLVND